jgi:hypothetical protein
LGNPDFPILLIRSIEATDPLFVFIVDEGFVTQGTPSGAFVAVEGATMNDLTGLLEAGYASATSRETLWVFPRAALRSPCPGPLGGARCFGAGGSRDGWEHGGQKGWSPQPRPGAPGDDRRGLRGSPLGYPLTHAGPNQG